MISKNSDRLPLAGLAAIALFLSGSWALAGQPVARSVLGHLALLSSAAFLPFVVWRRRREWAGCQRLFWNTLAIGMVFWILGHLGWAFDDLVLGQPSWLRWHTVFSLSAGIAPLIALFARPHRGVRPGAVASSALDLAASGLLIVFVYAHFVLVPSLVPGAALDAQERLLQLIEVNRAVLLMALAGAMWYARDTEWSGTYGRLAAGVAIGLIFRLGADAAIGRGEYRPGTFYDLAWITPWLAYGWAALQAPSSTAEVGEESPRAGSVTLSVVPVLLIPAVGYGGLFVDALGSPADAFRALLTGVTTICGLILLGLRLTVQGWALQRSDARLKLLAAATEQTSDLILITRADGVFEHANEAFVRALGYSRWELSSMGFADLLERDAVRAGRRIPDEIRQRGTWRGTLTRRRKDGTTFPAACTVVALHDAAGTITHFVGVERDISEELRLRDQLVHSERLSAIGELVAGVAHEINNPLQTIVGCVELMLDERSGAIDRSDLALVRQEAARAGQIVRNLLSFVRRGSGERVPADLNDIVRTMVNLREYHLHQTNIALVLRAAPHPLPVTVNRDEIQQVIMNLLLNAEQAIASDTGNGTITVEVGSAAAAHFVEILDTGPGITPELRGRIFEPFFTTKEVGQGTGLGLSISHGIASAHGGSLELCDSAVGARFRLTLPARVPEPSEQPSDRSGSERARRVLVIDDEPAIRELMKRLLGRRGFEVLDAATAEEALAIAAATSVSLVFCDVRMPGIGGVELHRRLLDADAALRHRFIFITGDSTAVQADPHLDGVPVLGKPFTAADLDALLANI